MSDTMIEVGSQVVLKAGGHVMTIESVAGKNAVCVWETNEGTRGEAEFPLANLVVYDGTNGRAWP